ncbi:hypothetical protein SB758_40550, partial [Burkholderia sp. SIMBA_013]
PSAVPVAWLPRLLVTLTAGNCPSVPVVPVVVVLLFVVLLVVVAVCAWAAWKPLNRQNSKALLNALETRTPVFM